MVTTTTLTDNNNRSSLEQKGKSGGGIVNQMMTRSTIYERNERRRLKTLAKANDARPASIRVLSQLPGFRHFVPPYKGEASTSNNKNSSATSSSSMTSSSTTTTPLVVQFADSTSISFGNNSRSNEVASENSNNKEFSTYGATTSTNTSQKVNLPNVIFIAGYLGGVGELFFGLRPKRTESVSPFFERHHPSSSSAVVQEGSGTLAFLRQCAFGGSGNGGHHHHPSSRGGIELSQISKGSGAAAILFGTKTFVDNRFVSSGGGHDNAIQSIASSAAAGAMGGLFRIATETSATASAIAANPGQYQSIFNRSVLGAVVYFSSYEATKKWLLQSTTDSTTANITKNDDSSSKTSNWLSIAASGALAGGLYQTVLLYGNTPSLHLQPCGMIMVSSSSPRVFNSIFRALPIHALLFLGYEKMVRGN